MTRDLEGRVALVTGGSRGIGRAVAIALAAAGARLAVGYREKEREARALAAALGGDAIAVGGDVADAQAVATLVAEVKSRLGAIDILVANAGIAKVVSAVDLDLATWDDTMNVNLRSAFVLSAAVVPDMRARGWGRLIYMGSVAARIGGIIGPHYAASKAGLEGLMHGYASQLARDGITANVIAPALIETDIIANAAGATPGRIPIGRFGTPEEVSSLTLAVATNAYITGQTFQVNGGLYST